MWKKVIGLVLAVALSLSFAVTAFAANPTSTNDTEAVYTAGWYFVAKDDDPTHEWDYIITTPLQITIGSGDTTSADVLAKIQGVTGQPVTVSKTAATVTVKNSLNNEATANVTFANLTLPISITDEQTVTGPVSAAFANGSAPLVKGEYSGDIHYSVNVG